MHRLDFAFSKSHFNFLKHNLFNVGIISVYRLDEKFERVGPFFKVLDFKPLKIYPIFIL